MRNTHPIERPTLRGSIDCRNPLGSQRVISKAGQSLGTRRRLFGLRSHEFRRFGCKGAGGGKSSLAFVRVNPQTPSLIGCAVLIAADSLTRTSSASLDLNPLTQLMKKGHLTLAIASRLIGGRIERHRQALCADSAPARATKSGYLSACNARFFRASSDWHSNFCLPANTRIQQPPPVFKRRRLHHSTRQP